jgi:hypothetical protein
MLRASAVTLRAPPKRLRDDWELTDEMLLTEFSDVHMLLLGAVGGTQIDIMDP